MTFIDVLEIREATETDAQNIADLVNATFRGQSGMKSWTSEAGFISGQRTDAGLVLKMIQAPDSKILLGFESRVLAACMHLRLDDAKRAFLGMLTVDPNRQTVGLGSRMVRAAEKFVVSQWQAQKLAMFVIGRRKELIEWYIQRGFRLTGEQSPFPYGRKEFGEPQVEDLYFEILEKPLVEAK
jgi:ribosomal protein S18 acetylase RimI-like enzyme